MRRSLLNIADDFPAPPSSFSDSVAPVGEAEFARLAEIFVSMPRLAAAVSGGSDSLALLFLLARWRRGLANPPALFALTVDHQLRPEAVEEAQHVRRIAKRLGVSHLVLRWRDDARDTGLQAQARAARYQLLGNWCRRNHVPALILAHQMEDQAATFLFRLARGSSPAGLASMGGEQGESPVLVRPLLSIRRARLRATLEEVGIGWREDPSNSNPHYARTHLERLLPFLAESGLPPEKLARAAEGAQKLRTRMEALAEALIIKTPSHLALPLAKLSALPPQSAEFVLGYALTRMNGEAYRPAAKSCRRIIEHLDEEIFPAVTLAKCRISREGEELIIRAEKVQKKPKKSPKKDSKVGVSPPYRL